MKLYTSYWGNVRKLRDAGIEPVAISRGKPKNWMGRSFDALAPTWNMLHMSDAEYYRAYERILSKVNADGFVAWLEAGLRDGCDGVALLCWEKDPNECHRKRVAEWLRESGYEVEEFTTRKIVVDIPEQGALF